MTSDTQALLERILRALPFSCQQRLIVMGWEENPHARDPARFLLRAVGGPQPVHLIDLELDPERWHGRYVSTQGEIQWPGRSSGPACIGKLWLDTSLLTSAQIAEAHKHAGRSRLVGVFMAQVEQPSSESLPFSNAFDPAAHAPFVACFAVVSISSDAA